MLKKYLSLILFVFFVLPLFSQQKSETLGFRISDNAFFHFGFTLLSDYDSNVTHASDKSTFTSSTGSKKIGVVSDFVLHYSPYVKLKINDNFKTLGMSLLFTYNHYLGIDNSDTAKKLSDFNIYSDILGEFNKKSFLAIRVNNSFRRTSEAKDQAVTGVHSNISNMATIDFLLKNSSETLLLKISPGINFNYFEESFLSSSNFYSIKGNLFARWKFLPKTMLFFDTSFMYHSYYKSKYDVNSAPLNIFIGLLGQITPKFSSKLSVGYVTPFAKVSVNDVIASVKFVYNYSQNLMFKLGYSRTYLPSYLTAFYRQDKPYLSVNFKFYQKWLLAFDASYAHIVYGDDLTLDSNLQKTVSNKVVTANTKNRIDDVIYITPYLAYNILDWFGAKIQYSFNYKTSNYNQTSVKTIDSKKYTSKYYFDYVEHKIFLNLVLDY